MLKELTSLLLVFLGLLFFLSLMSFSQADPNLNHKVSGAVEIKNWAGIFGAYLAGFFADLFGVSSYFLALGIVGLAVRRSIPSLEVLWWRWLGLLLLALCVAAASSAWAFSLGEIRGGGICGKLISSVAIEYLSGPGALLALVFMLMASIYMVTGISWITIFKWFVPKPKPKKEDFKKTEGRSAQKMANVYSQGHSSGLLSFDAERSVVQGAKKTSRSSALLGGMIGALGDAKNFVLAKMRGKGPAASTTQPEADFDSLAGHDFDQNSGQGAELLGDLPFGQQGQAAGAGQQPALQSGAKSSILSGAPSGPSGKKLSAEAKLKLGALLGEDEEHSFSPKNKTSLSKENELPSLSLLSAPAAEAVTEDDMALEAKGRNLMDCLADFSISGKLFRIVPGPVVTMFEIKPAPGVKVSRIASLADDIALAMKALAVRVQAPIPGTDTVGIEIPNELRETVCFREILASPIFARAGSLLTMALGKDITGKPEVADLAKMPHLLVAGATGAGKSVCLNSILLSLLFKAQPSELKLLLIDPKRIELAMYADLPHLVHPVVTEMPQAKNALDWAVQEMDRRYAAIAQLGVRNIAGYNEKLQQLKKSQPESAQNLEAMPYLVIVIDELADLMLTAGKEVEVAIVRLAQLARAAGIHLILATQRPSVDVVTGLIKANFPCRIAFQVTSKHDSRTILDTVGAEHLLGKGDMLFKPGGGRMQRLHGAFVPDGDVVATVDFWKKRFPPQYELDFSAWRSEESFGLPYGGGGGENDVVDDPLYGEAVEFVMEQGKASISLIQRRFRIGFNKAARFVEQMEQDGIIGPPDGSRPRTVIK